MEKGASRDQHGGCRQGAVNDGVECRGILHTNYELQLKC